MRPLHLLYGWQTNLWCITDTYWAAWCPSVSKVSGPRKQQWKRIFTSFCRTGDQTFWIQGNMTLDFVLFDEL